MFKVATMESSPLESMLMLKNAGIGRMNMGIIWGGVTCVFAVGTVSAMAASPAMSLAKGSQTRQFSSSDSIALQAECRHVCLSFMHDKNQAFFLHICQSSTNYRALVSSPAMMRAENETIPVQQTMFELPGSWATVL